MTATQYQRLYYRHRLCGGAGLETLSAAMDEAGYTPAASWFKRWDEAAEQRGLQLEREMGLVCGTAARAEFFNEAMRQLMRELARQSDEPGADGRGAIEQGIGEPAATGRAVPTATMEGPDLATIAAA